MATTAQITADERLASRHGNYRYRSFNTRLLMSDFRFGKESLGQGDRVPEFDLPTTTVERLRSRDRAGRPLLLIFGSVSCPMTAASTPSLTALYAEFGDRVEFATLYVREAHPGEKVPQPETLAEKLEHAKSFQELDAIPWTVAVDDIEGTLHRALDPKPNAAYLIDSRGIIAFRSLWAGDEKGLRRALSMLVKGQRPSKPQSTAMFAPLAQGMGRFREVMLRSGRRAERDVLLAAPPIAVVARLASLFRPLSATARGVAAMTSFGLLAIGAAALVLGLVT